MQEGGVTAAQGSSTIGEGARNKLSGFVRLLRDNAFTVGLAETRDALQIMGQGHAARPSLLGAALKTLFCSRQSDWTKFDELFDAYWLQRGMKSATRIQGAPQKAPAGIPALAAGQRGEGREENPDRVERGEGSDENEAGKSKREGASRTELLSQTDFRHLTQGEDIAAAHALAERLSKSMRARLTRRMRARRNGQRIDLRRTIHKSIAHGGTPLDLVRRKRKDKPLRLVVLLDASGSMSLYSSVFLRFMHGVLDIFREAEAFVFHTRLIHISPALREKNAQRAMERMSILAQGTGGGTRIGASLATFNRWHAKRCITSRTCVMIVSDGYDTGPAEELGLQMQALRRRCKRIAWLNPMIGWQDYAPEAAGMKAALPYVDLFAPAHNLQSLEALEPYLARI
jgi:uncharacterized protein with von Willebrand factor type A (vWA) domain